MIKARILLGLVIIASASTFGFGLSFFISKSDYMIFFKALSLFFGPIFLVSSLFMFIYSFFGIHENSDGQLVYDPNDFYWKTLRKFSSEWLCSNWNFSVMGLCGAIWRTSLFVAAVTAVTLYSFFAVFLISAVINLIATSGLPELDSYMIALLISTIFLIAALFLQVFENKNTRYLSWPLVVFALGVVPIYTVGIVEWLRIAGLMAVIVIGSSLVVSTAMWVSKKATSNSDNSIKWLFTATTKRTCPVLVSKYY